MDVKALTLADTTSLKAALELLNNTALGTIFIVDPSQKLVGVLTDGDVRRGLLDGKTLESPVSLVMNPHFTALPVDTDNSVILEKISNNVKVIPLVDGGMHLVDYASINKIRRISVASPLLTGNELAYVTECIKTSWISSAGKFVKTFEENFSTYHNGLPALAVSNGTVALHLALEALGIGPGDEVIVPDLTFAASVNAIIYTGATPVLADIEKDTWNIDMSLVEGLITPKTKAIMPVHLYGHPCDMEKVMSLAKKHGLFVIEDCAEALGSLYKGQPVGTFGDVSTFSFYGNKTITTGEGGMCVFKDAAVAEKAATLRDHGMKKSRRYWHESIGYNYRLTNIQAAIGVAQFERLQEFVKSKMRIAQAYTNVLSKMDCFQPPVEKDYATNSYWLYTFMIHPSAKFRREDLMDYLHLKGIETRPVFFPMHIMPPYQHFGNPEKLRTSALVSEHAMSLPSSVNLSDAELDYICEQIAGFANNK
ncbi:aminotransferase class I/II-fold pyridoxal phosphate-dependent enzyme [Chitinophaga lutea]